MRVSSLLNVTSTLRRLTTCARCQSTLKRHEPCTHHQNLSFLPHTAHPPSASQLLLSPSLSSSSDLLSTARDLKRVVEDQDNVLTSTFYRRPLPSHLIAFTSQEGKRLFKESLSAGYSENYFALAGTFMTQSEPAYCGLGSLSMVLNALEIDPKRRWKGDWRWYSDEMLECCAPLQVIKQRGITFREFSCLAKCNGLHVIAKQADQVSLEEFTQDLKSCTSNQLQRETHMVVAFSRQALGQTGEGHFSPVTSYHPDRNSILVLDTARFKYPSYYVNVKQLYDAMHPNDIETQSPRGYFLLQRRDSPTIQLEHTVPLCTVSSVDATWEDLAKTFCKEIPSKLLSQSYSQQTLHTLVETLLHCVQQTFKVNFRDVGIDRTLPQQNKLAQESMMITYEQQRQNLIQQVTSHSLFSLTHTVLTSCNRTTTQSLISSWPINHNNSYPHDYDHHLPSILATILLLSIPRESFVRAIPAPLFEKFEGLRGRLWLAGRLKFEVERIHDQIHNLTNEFCACKMKEDARSLCWSSSH